MFSPHRWVNCPSTRLPGLMSIIWLHTFPSKGKPFEGNVCIAGKKRAELQALAEWTWSRTRKPHDWIALNQHPNQQPNHGQSPNLGMMARRWYLWQLSLSNNQKCRNHFSGYKETGLKVTFFWQSCWRYWNVRRNLNIKTQP
jgi:hypothetical protein